MNQKLYDQCGTPMYMAPEILLSSKNKGYEGLLRKKGQGRKSKLTKKQLETLKKN